MALIAPMHGLCPELNFDPSYLDVIRIWDSLFADENRFSFLICFCAAMMM